MSALRSQRVHGLAIRKGCSFLFWGKAKVMPFGRQNSMFARLSSSLTSPARKRLSRYPPALHVMDIHFTLNEAQSNASNAYPHTPKEAVSDVAARLDIPQSALFRMILQDQDALKSFLQNVPSILLNDAVQAKKDRKILATSGLKDVKLLQERWRSKREQNRQGKEGQHEIDRNATPQRLTPTMNSGPPMNKRPIETTVHSILTTLETLQHEQRKILDDPSKIAMIVSEGMRSYYAVDRALKFMSSLYPSLPTMFEVPYQPGYIMSYDVGFCNEHPLMSNQLAQFYEQVFGTCTKLHFRFRTILEHYELELYKRFHNLAPGPRSLEELEESLAIWFRNLTTSATFVAAIEKAEMTKDYSTLAVIRQTADSLGGVANLLKFSIPEALVSPSQASQTQHDSTIAPTPSSFNGGVRITLSLFEDNASIAEVCSDEPARQCKGFFRAGRREFNMTSMLVNPAGSPVHQLNTPESSTASQSTGIMGREHSLGLNHEAHTPASRLSFPAHEDSANNRQVSEAEYDSNRQTPVGAPLAERSTVTGKRGRSRKTVPVDNARSVPQSTTFSAKRPRKGRAKPNIPPLVLHQTSTESPQHIEEPTPQMTTTEEHKDTALQEQPQIHNHSLAPIHNDYSLLLTQNENPLPFMQIEDSLPVAKNENLPVTQHDDSLPFTQDENALPVTQNENSLQATENENPLPVTQNENHIPVSQNGYPPLLVQNEQLPQPTQNEHHLPLTPDEPSLPLTSNEPFLPPTQNENPLPVAQVEDPLPLTQTEQPLSYTPNDLSLSLTHEEHSFSTNQHDQNLPLPLTENITDTVAANHFATSTVPDGFQFTDHTTNTSTECDFDYNFLSNMNMQMNNQPYIIPYCPISQSLFQAATAFLGYDTSDYQQLQMQMPTPPEHENTDALDCLSDVALNSLNFPPFNGMQPFGEVSQNGNFDNASGYEQEGGNGTVIYEERVPTTSEEQGNAPENSAFDGYMHPAPQPEDEGDRDAEGETDVDEASMGMGI
ncbi:hypothetical protein BJ508DRAFT_372771 [Ascobolus immersus RN42]|uniref:Uncharacterized protein n=1 Tax=Ascobolus immersus RN42 TaxID=1160509 RepID=A0A3N4IXX0_ASCIM|nr:hypothetical protein BJ508DRAFT_372771 [Ascobolus immersus RN42]